MVVVIDKVTPNLTTRQVSGWAVGATHLERTLGVQQTGASRTASPLNLLVVGTWQTLIRITSIRTAIIETAER